MAHHNIRMVPVTQNKMGYGIRAQSEYVYETNVSNYPTRVMLWDNTVRTNKRNGEPVQYGKFGPIDGGNGRWLDPHNKATDDMLTILLSTESIGISSTPGMSTGQPGSGQEWAVDDKLRDGDTATLVYNGEFGQVEVTLHFPRHSNGHGYATFGVDTQVENV